MISQITFNKPIERFHKRKPITLDFKLGVNVLCGPNGCGKSTTISVFETVMKETKMLWWGNIAERFEELDCSVVGSLNPCISYDSTEYEDTSWSYDNMNIESIASKFSSKGEGKKLYHSEWMNRQIKLLSEESIKSLKDKGYDYSIDNFVITCDEPENSLDFINQQKFVKWIDGQAKATPKAQIIIASHSPFVIDYAIKNKEVNLICFDDKWLSRLTNSYKKLF